MSSRNQPRQLEGLPAEQAVVQAAKFIEEESKQEQTGLLSRFKQLNRANGKFFRFETVYYYGGFSGAGKSYFLSMLYSDFMNNYLQRKYVRKKLPIILHFGFEMAAKKELVRMVAAKLGMSYTYVTSGEYDPDKDQYVSIAPMDKQIIDIELQAMANMPIMFYENTGNLQEIDNTVRGVKSRFPDREIIIGIDHTLLIKELDEGGETELLAATGKQAIVWKKRDKAMVILLGQLNGEIEKAERRDPKKPYLHYPVKTDLHGSKQIFHAADVVGILHRPELLRIEKYGTEKLKTEKLIHLLYLKHRDSMVGNVWLREQFEEGGIGAWNEGDTLALSEKSESQ